MSKLSKTRSFQCSVVIALAVVSCTDWGGTSSRSARTVDGPAFELDGRALALAGELDAERLREHMVVLAGDAMEGRETGSVGDLRAASYVAEQFRSLGLEPLGEHGGYLQPFELLESRLSSPLPSLSLSSRGTTISLDLKGGFVRWGGFGATEERVEARLVFVGYGVQAPDLDHDDYAGINVEGAIVVALRGAPPSFGSDERAYYSSSATKRLMASTQGAVGILMVRTPGDRERRPWDWVLEGLEFPAMTWLAPSGEPGEAVPDLPGSATLSDSGAEALFELAGRDLDQLFERHENGHIESFELGVDATLTRRSLQRRVASLNVVGRLVGSDPQLSEEHLVVTAHLDHLGARRNAEGLVTEIYNGAYDNAAGVGTLLEVARVLSEARERPRRSILFVALGAEEQGLQGSDFFAHYPPVPIESLVANLNIDMPYLGFPIADIEAFGVEHSQLAVGGQASRRGQRHHLDPRLHARAGALRALGPVFVRASGRSGFEPQAGLTLSGPRHRRRSATRGVPEPALPRAQRRLEPRVQRSRGRDVCECCSVLDPDRGERDSAATVECR